jgi:uncharacterized protein (UPF0332 family)
LPTAKEHREQAEHNEFFVSELDNPFWDWAVAGTFYAALHYVDGFLMLSGIDPPRHSDRNSIIESNPTLSKIWLEYKQLYNDSKLARYEIHKFTQEDVRLLRDSYFKPIKDYLIPRLPK